MINATGLAFRTVLIVLTGVACARPAIAKSISISVTSSTELNAQTLTARVRITNSGDESAHAVTPILRFRESVVRGTATSQLSPNQSIDHLLVVEVGQLATGRWPFAISVDYSDANHYPFQAVHAGLFEVGHPPPGKLIVTEISATPVGGQGKARIRLKNLSAAVRDATMFVSAPEGIEISSPRHEIHLGPWEATSTSVPIVNRSAVVGSHYPIIVTLSYDDEGIHHTTAAQGVVDVVAIQPFFRSQRGALWTLAVLIVCAWIGFLTWRRATRRKREAVSHP